MSYDPEKLDLTLIAGLIQKPKRVSLARNLDSSAIRDIACRFMFMAIVSHYRDSAKVGRIRYATANSIERSCSRKLATNSSKLSKRQRRKRRVVFESIQDLLQEIQESWDAVTDEVFQETVDDLSEDFRDSKTKEAIEGIVETYARSGYRGIYQAVSQLAAELNPLAGDDSGMNWQDDATATYIRAKEAVKDKSKLSIPTPYPQLNRLLNGGGGRRGCLWLYAAYTSDGKTVGAVNLAYHAAIVHGRGVLIATREQGRDEIMDMLACRHSHKFVVGGLRLGEVSGGELDKKQFKVLRQATEDIQMNPKYGRVYLWDTPPGTTVGDVRARAELVAQKQPLDMVVMDHTELFEPENCDRGTNKSDRVAEVLKQTKDLAKSFLERRGLWVVLTHQIKREGYEKGQTRGFYLLSDLSATSEAERSADQVIWLWRDDGLRDLSEIRMGVAKNRQGPVNSKGFELVEDYATSSLFPLAE